MQNATFVGYETVNGTNTEHWKVEGLQENDYWQIEASHTPVRLLQKPNDDMQFVGFNTGPIDPATFAVPQDCSSQCGGVCSLL